MPGIDPVSASVGAAVSLAQTVTGFVNKAKARKEAKELARTRPERRISPLIGQDLDLAESELASGGLSSSAENAYNNLNNQQFAASLGAILRGGGSVNNVADVFGENETGRQRLALLNDQMRVGQIDRLSRARSQMADEEQRNFEFNEWMPYADRVQANAEARRGADQQIWNGLTSIGGQAMSYFGAKADENSWNKLLNPPRANAATPTTNTTQPVEVMRTTVGAPNIPLQQRNYPTVQPIDPNTLQNIPGADPDNLYQWWQ